MNVHMHQRHIPWLLWPFAAVWRLVAGVISLTGRLLALVLGVIFMIVGAILTLTIVGAILGVPLLIFGFLLIIRGFF